MTSSHQPPTKVAFTRAFNEPSDNSVDSSKAPLVASLELPVSSLSMPSPHLSLVPRAALIARGDTRALRRARTRTPGVGRMIAVAFLLACAWSQVAHGQEPIMASEPSVLKETSVDLLNVASSVDKGDPFDLNLSLAF